MKIIDLYGVRHEGKDISAPATLVITREEGIVFSHFGETMRDLPYGETVLEKAIAAKKPAG